MVEGGFVKGNLKVYGKCLGSVQEVSGAGIALWEYVLLVIEVCGEWVGSDKEVSGPEMSDAFVARDVVQPNCSANVLEGRFVKCNLKVSGKCLGSVQEVSGPGIAFCCKCCRVCWKCLGSVWEVSCTCLGSV